MIRVMNLIPSSPARGLILLCGTQAINASAHRLLLALILHGEVHLLDAGNRLQPYTLTRLLRQHTPNAETLLSRLHLQRAFTAHQVLAALEALPASSTPLLGLDLLAPFYEETLPLPQARALLQRTLTQIERLQQRAPLMITLSPPPQPARRPLWTALRQHATAIFDQPEPPTRPEQLLLW